MRAPSSNWKPAEHIRKPTISDIPEIKGLIDQAAESGAVLPRMAAELQENLRDFFVYVDEDGVGGCCALHIDTEELAEIRSLVVTEDRQGRGIGVALVDAAIEEAGRLGMARVYALTRIPRFFQKQGFEAIDKHDLPSKVYRDCVRCPLFPDCDEVAMIRILDGSAPR